MHGDNWPHVPPVTLERFEPAAVRVRAAYARGFAAGLMVSAAVCGFVVVVAGRLWELVR